MSDPFISILMPAYNVEKYIGKAIESVLNQTYTDWELIICDDCSSDNTVKIISNYNDRRIKCINLMSNSGAALIPRKNAFYASKGEWILNLDADDYIDNEYLFKTVERIEQSECDVCCGRMLFIDMNEKYFGYSVPAENFNIFENLTGIEAFNYTIPNYLIGLNGACVKRDIWERAINECPIGSPARIHDDEGHYRIILLNSNKVVFSESRYYIRENPNSVTHKEFSIRNFDWMESNKDFLIYIDKKFGKKTQEYSKFVTYDFNCLKNLLARYCSSPIYTNLDNFNYIYNIFYDWYRQINFCLIEDSLSHTNKILCKKFPFLMLYMTLLSKNVSHIYFILKHYFNTLLLNSIYKNKMYLWYILRKKREIKIRESIISVYSHKGKKINDPENITVNIYDGNIHSGGLADRFRGIVSTYLICKERGIAYKLLYREPFPLHDFLLPNKYNWEISDEHICYDLKNINLIVLDTTQDSVYQLKKQRKYLLKKLRPMEQNHVYTNAAFSYTENFSEAFYDLFKPTERLKNAIDKQLHLIGSDYISVSCRFLDLLGDFNEPFGYNKTLSENEKENLLNKLKSEISRLHEHHKEMKILVNSDSITFLNYISNIKYVYIIPGIVTHIDNDKEKYTYERYEKTFLDFFLISKAKHIYLLKNSEMFSSGFPFAAAKVGNVPFDKIDI